MLTTMTTPITWMKNQLFSTWYNTVITLLTLVILYYLAIKPFYEWGIANAVFVAHNRMECMASGKHGACWGFVTSNWGRFIYGLYPIGERWRVNVGFILIFIFIGPIFSKHIPNPPRLWRKPKVWFAIFDLTLLPMILFILLRGGLFGLLPVDTNLWGGFLLTVVLASTGVICSLPLSVLFALGRRSTMPVIKAFSVVYIEFIRAVPLITLLFMATTMLPLLAPKGVTFNDLGACIVAIILFSSAYMAEVIRAGLQGVEAGQYEAAKALGLGYWQSRLLIILPQAFAITLPNIVSTIIGIFKDTSLVIIVGLFDLLGMVEVTLTDPNWLGGYVYEGFMFAAVLYFICCFLMSRYSMRLEKNLQTQDNTL